MRRTSSSRARVTIYRLAHTPSLRSRLRTKYVEAEGFTIADVAVGDIDGLLISGRMANRRVRWAEALADITGEPIDLGNETAAAVLLLPVSDAVFAICYGMGFHLIDYESVDAGFGLRYAARMLEPDQLRSVTRHTMDRRARIERRSIPAGGDARAFGLNEFGTVASKVVGKETATLGGASGVTIRGADGLNIPVGRSAPALLADLQRIEETLRQPVSHPDLALLTRVTPLMPNHPRRRALNERLTAALRGELDDALLGTGWPWDRADEFTVVESVRLLVPGENPADLPWLTIEDLTAVVAERRSRDPLALLRAARVMLLADLDGGELASPLMPAVQWIAFETRLDDRLYFFHDGRWFTIADDYVDEVRREVEQILTVPAPVALPPWPPGVPEEEYNRTVAGADPRFLALDRQLVRTLMQPRGFEACDLLGPDGEFVHTKRLHRSADASHLFQQALVSTESLILDVEARTTLIEKVASLSSEKRPIPERPKEVVLALGRSHPITVDSLFTFSQVTLVRLVQHLNAHDVKVSVVWVPES